MTTAQATEYTAFIANRAVRAQVIASLLAGRSAVCPDCNEIFNPETGCTRCDTVRFDTMAAEYDAQEMDRDAALYGREDFALVSTASDEAAFDKMIEQRNFFGSDFDA